MTEQWNELRATISELRDNGGTGTQQDVCKFLVNLMDALEKQMQEPCKDCISRQAAIDELRKCRFVVDAIEKIKALPPAQPGWIPVTERLPTENDSYLVWMPFTPEGHHITVTGWRDSYWNIKTPITAWMPLPKPYGEESWEEEDDCIA